MRYRDFLIGDNIDIVDKYSCFRAEVIQIAKSGIQVKTTDSKYKVRFLRFDYENEKWGWTLIKNNGVI